MTPTATKKLIDIAEIRRTLGILVEPGQVFEVRTLEASTQPSTQYTNTLAGYFDNADDAIRAISTIRSALGFYITLQVCHPDLLGRIYNKLQKQKKDFSTGDQHILRYKWLAIDCDPERLSQISSTDEQHERALSHSRHIKKVLAELGFGEPLEGDSGNGAHLLYRIDLENTPENIDLLKRTLEGLATRFDIEGLHIDQTVFNPARIWKLYGTLACKGDDTPKWPHRLSRIVAIPASLQTVSRKLLEQIAVSATVVTTPLPKYENGDAFDLEGFIRKHSIDTFEREIYRGGYRWILKQCPFCQESDRGACLFLTPSGAAAFRCQHNRCNGKEWQDFRVYFEPDAYTRKQDNSTKKSMQLPRSAPVQEQVYSPVPPTHSNNGNGNHGNVPPSTGLNLCSFSADDAGNGDAMFALFGQDFLYCSTRGWFTHDKTYWQLDADSAEVRKKAVETLRLRRHAAVDAKQEAIVKCTVANENRVNGCVSRFKTLVSISIDEFDIHPDMLNCKNGVVDLRTGNIEKHTREQRFTYCLPVEYDRADYTEWLDYLNGVIGGGQEVIDYLQMALGYSFTGHTQEEILFYLFGPTRSGKGTFAETIMALLPTPISKMVDFNSFTAKREGDVSNFDLAPLKPSRIIFASESNKSQSLNPAKIKQLTGGDHITCCFKHKDFFSYRPQFKVWMMSNHPVNGDPEDDALWGRVRVIEFPNSFLGMEDKSKKARLKSTGALKGVLWWIVEGAIKWYALGPKGLVTPSAIVKTTQAHRDELDYVQQWLDESANDENEVTGPLWTANEVVMASYSAWCKNNNVLYSKGPKTLAQSLKAKGYRVSESQYIPAEKRTKRGVGGMYISFISHTHTDHTDESV